MSELDELSAEHYLAPGESHCHAASDDACAWNDGWPCRIRLALDDLREKADHMETSRDEWYRVCQVNEQYISELRAENERLRSALKDLVSFVRAWAKTHEL
jgi:hypothetical protein